MRRLLSALWLFVLCLAVTTAISQNTSSQTQATAPGTAQKASTKTDSGASASDIAAAKASHKVWVNLDTGIYHKGGRWYGKTKNGKFMTEDDAKKAGYKSAKRD
jgi:hypothetical protein